MRSKSAIKVIRFVFVGLMNTAFGYLIFAGLTWFGCPDVLAVPAAMMVGVIFNFLSYGGIVFSSLDARHLPRFVAAYLGLYACNLFGLRMLARFDMNAYAAQAVLVVPLAALAYLLNDRWVFHGT
jgi:putative flippase GtrA